MINPNAIRFWWNGNGGSVEDGSPQRLITDILSFNDRARYSFASNRPQFFVDTDEKAYLRNDDVLDSSVVLEDAVPAAGTILLWDKHDYEPSGQIELLNFNGDGYLAYEEDGIEVNIGGGSFIAVSDKEWQANGVFKPWFYALTYNATTVTIYRGDKEGNLTLALPATAHGGSPSVEDLVLNSPARDSVHLNSDILTTDEQLTEAQITAIYNGSLPIFQTRAYKGDNFDRVRQKVANEVNGTFDQEGVAEARSVAFFDLYSVYHPTAKAYFEYVESEGGVITDRSSLNDDITNFLTQELS
jgi:hypothetical protein